MTDRLIHASTPVFLHRPRQRHQGRLDTLGPCVIRSDEGRFVRDSERWSFLTEGGPGTASPGGARAGSTPRTAAGPAMLRRAQYMYGFGQGASSGTAGLIPPTDLVTETGQILELGGVRPGFQLILGAVAPAEMNLIER
ncbi:hypothetical protein ABZS81_23600 [Streptomyces sp. NPDC005318]|uniref:hypothetical protein n=1 Tax=Streptomyces sp. NPDC005318 TaxID=3157031 RepID=UPI0033BB26A2